MSSDRFRILFGLEPVRNGTICRRIDPSRFEVTCQSFDDPPEFGLYDAVVPLTLPDLWQLQQR